MFAQTTIMPKEVKLYKLDLNKDGGQNIIHPEPLQKGDTINSGDDQLIFEGNSTKDSTMTFSFVN